MSIAKILLVVFALEAVLAVWAVGRVAGTWHSPLTIEASRLASPR